MIDDVSIRIRSRVLGGFFVESAFVYRTTKARLYQGTMYLQIYCVGLGG
jgi:hypothetical protein